MRWKTTLFLLLATLGLGAYVSRIELREPTRETREQQSRYIVHLSPETVRQCAIESPAAGSVTLSRSEHGWVMAPEGFRADAEQINGLLEAAGDLRLVRTLTGSPEKPLDPSAYGLQPPEGTLTVMTDREPLTLRFGAPTPVKDQRYLMLSGRKEIFVVSAAMFQQLDQPRDRFRDPVLLRLGQFPGQISLVAPSRSFTLSRQQMDWRLTQPVADAADSAVITRSLQQLGAMRIQRFVDDAPAVEHRAAWGFDPPAAELTLTPPDGSPPVTLFFGAELPDAKELRYAKRSDEPSLYAVDAKDLDAVLIDPNSLRARHCFHALSSQVMRIEVRRDQSGWIIERPSGLGTAWLAVGLQIPLDQQQAEAFAVRVSGLQVSGFVDEAPADLARYGLAAPGGTISLTVEANRPPQRLLIGAAIPGSKERYGLIEGRPAVVRLPKELEEVWFGTPERLQAPAQPAPERPTSSAPE